MTPPSTLIRTGRLQRLSSKIAGPGWAMLPHTAGFVDPLHSTGIAHSLAGVERLAKALLDCKDFGRNSTGSILLQRYDSVVRDELKLIDQLVAGCYNAISQRSFRKFAAFTMCYFAAATTWERQRIAKASDRHSTQTFASNAHCPALLCADVPEFVTTVQHLQARIQHETDESFENLCRKELAPFNHVGLFEPPTPNMYGGTAVPEKGKH